MFATLIKLLSKEGLPDSIKNPVVDAIFEFISNEQNAELALKWLDAGAISHPDDSAKELYTLTASHKRSIVKNIYMTPDSAKLSLEFKKQLLEKVVGDDKSDVANMLRLTCESGTADS